MYENFDNVLKPTPEKLDLNYTDWVSLRFNIKTRNSIKDLKNNGGNFDYNYLDQNLEPLDTKIEKK